MIQADQDALLVHLLAEAAINQALLRILHLTHNTKN